MGVGERSRRAGQTIKLSSSPPFPLPSVSSWPGLASVLVKALHLEIVDAAQRGARTAPTAATSRALRAFVEAADAPDRWPGTVGALTARAGRVLGHVRDVLVSCARDAPAAVEAAATLRASLLPVPAYCAAAPGVVMADLTVWAADVRALAAPGGDGAAAAATLAALLRATAGDVGERARRAAGAAVTRVLEKAADNK